MDLVTVSRSLAALSLLAGGIGLLLLVMLAIPQARRRMAGEMEGEVQVLLGAAWLTALVSTAGSLYLSQVAGFVPCTLCWYQRIAMYPLVLVVGAGALAADHRTWRYALPLSVAGGATAVYHILVQLRPALDAGACSAQVPCTMRYLYVFGFVSIPVMALGGFLLISALLVAARVARPAD
ncbi:MAG: disulfide bond formation protein B [Gemmatimonadota bacterium]